MFRFAPSPTGDMHISDLRIAIVNFLVAQQKSDQFLVRIEDIDTKRNIEGKDTEIMMILEKFALKHVSVFHQSEHLNLYQTLALKLLKEEKAFICKCTHTELEQEKEKAKTNKKTYSYSGHCENLTQEDYNTLKTSGKKFSIRLKKPEVNMTHIDSFIILNTEGLPTYNFACAADDMMSNIDFVIRGEEHLLNTPKQIHIKNLLGYENETQYAHIPNILEAPSLQSLFEEGFIPDAILNYLLLLGNPKVPNEIFTLPEAIEWFDLNSLSQSETRFDMTKLRSINSEHLRLMDDKQLSTLFGFADADIGQLAKVYLEECATTNELEAKIRPIFKAKDFTIKNGKEMKVIADIIGQSPAFETFDELKKHLTKESGLKGDNLLNPLRYLLTQAGNGPELSKIYPLIKSYILEVAS